MEPREVHVGDRLTLSVALSTASGETPLPFSPPADWGPFELVAVASSGTLHTVTLATFEVETATIPALTFNYRDAAGRAVALKTPPIPVAVKSVLTPDAKGLKGMKGKAARLGPPLWPLLPVVLLAAVFFLWRRRRKRAPGERSPWTETLAEDEEALRALAELDALLNGPAKPYYSRLADAWRVYVERRFGLSLMDRTTAETLPLLKELPIPPEDRVPLRALLEAADLAKFARFESPVDERRRHQDTVRAFVLATRRRPAEEAIR